MDHLEQFNALRQCYGAYLADCRQRAQDAGPLRGLTHLLAGPSLQDRQAVDRFFQQLKDVVSALDRTDLLLAAQAVEYMLLTAQGCNDESRLAFQAAEGFSLELIALLPGEDARRILAGYTARYPRRRLLLPKQKEVLAALERAAQR